MSNRQDINDFTKKVNQEAHNYCENGIAAFPLRPNRKEPAQDEWQKKPFPTHSDIDQWFDRPYNLGIRTGQASRGLFVVDVDNKNGKNGFAAWQQIVGEHELPETEIVDTPNGRHLYFLTPEGENPPRNNAGKLAEGVDLRGDGGYVVAPPTATDEGEYVLYDDPERDIPDIKRVATCPNWLWEVIKRSGRKPQGAPNGFKPSNDGKNAPRLILEGERNDAMVRLAGTLVNKGLTGETIRRALLSHNEQCCIPPLDVEEIDRIIQQTGSWEVRSQYETVWLDSLQRTSKGDIKGTMSNVLLFLRNDSRLWNLWRYNELGQVVEICNSPPWEPPTDSFEPREWTEDDVSDFRCWLSDERKLNYPMQEPGKEAVHDAVNRHAKTFRYNPIQEYLTSLVWDGEPRIDHFFSDFCDSEPSVYSAWVGQVLFLGAAQRALRPGCLHRMVPILVGPESVGKSEIIRRLAKHEWSREMTLDLSDKDALMSLAKHWLIELSELAALKRTRELEIIKDFISRTEDTYRPPYGRMNVSTKRGCVFVGTSNDQDFLQPGEQNTRFLPIYTPAVHLGSLNEWVIDQLWAEAAKRVSEGEQWWMPTQEAWGSWRESIKQHESTDSWAEAVLDYAHSQYVASLNRYEVTIADVWTEGFGGALSKLGPQEQIRIARILKESGFQKKQIRKGGQAIRVFIKESETS